MKLLASVSKGSIALFFFILMWRAVHHYELAPCTLSLLVALTTRRSTNSNTQREMASVAIPLHDETKLRQHNHSNARVIMLLLQHAVITTLLALSRR